MCCTNKHKDLDQGLKDRCLYSSCAYFIYNELGCHNSNLYVFLSIDIFHEYLYNLLAMLACVCVINFAAWLRQLIIYGWEVVNKHFANQIRTQ